MIRYSKVAPSLLQTIKYQITPTSCYDILAKPNPIISVTIGNDDGIFCNLNLRVKEFLFSYLIMLFQRQQKTIKNYFWVLRPIKNVI
jgi:hypothetical protein